MFRAMGRSLAHSVVGRHSTGTRGSAEGQEVEEALDCPRPQRCLGIEVEVEEWPSCSRDRPRGAATWAEEAEAPGRAGSHRAGHFDTWLAVALRARPIRRRGDEVGSNYRRHCAMKLWLSLRSFVRSRKAVGGVS